MSPSCTSISPELGLLVILTLGGAGHNIIIVQIYTSLSPPLISMVKVCSIMSAVATWQVKSPASSGLQRYPGSAVTWHHGIMDSHLTNVMVRVEVSGPVSTEYLVIKIYE